MSELIGKYNFDINDYNTTTINDHSSNNYHLSKTIETDSGDAGWKTENPYSDPNIYSYRFQRSETGTGSYFVRENILSNPYTGDFSVSFWCKPQGETMVKHESFVSFHDSNTLDTFQIGMASGGQLISVVTKASNNEFFPIGSYSGYIESGSNTKWTFIAVTFDNTTSTLKTYLREQEATTFNSNNYDQSTTPSTSGHNFDMHDIKIGSNRNNTHRYNGLLTLLGVYDRVLTDSEITMLFTSNEICYHPNTSILTDKGNVKITDLKRGDLIKTLKGFKPLAKLIKNIHVKTKFVKFPKNCFGDNIPNQDLHITTGHPVYFNDEFYLPENFIGEKNIELVSKDTVNVYHLQFDTHEVIYSNNFTTTSLPPNTDYLNFHLKEEEFIDKTKYNKENIGKMYPPYMLHEEPLFIREINF